MDLQAIYELATRITQESALSQEEFSWFEGSFNYLSLMPEEDYRAAINSPSIALEHKEVLLSQAPETAHRGIHEAFSILDTERTRIRAENIDLSEVRKPLTILGDPLLGEERRQHRKASQFLLKLTLQTLNVIKALTYTPQHLLWGGWR